MPHDPSIFTAVREENGDIIIYNTGKKVGIDIDREKNLLKEVADRDEVIENWKPLMIKHGYIEIPKTPEQIALETANQQLALAQQQVATSQEFMQEMLATLKSIQHTNITLTGEIKELKQQWES